MLFSDVMLDNLAPYVNIINLCITSSKTVDRISHYYACYIPIKLPCMKNKVDKRSKDGWDIFTDKILSRPLFVHPSNFRLRLCVLLDFLKAEKSFYTDPILTPHPMTNMYIESEMIYYRYGKGCMDELDEYWDTECFSDLDRVGYYGTDCAPFEFTLKNRSSLNVLRGIVYLQSEYEQHKWDLAIESQDRYPGDIFNDPYREEFHVVHAMNCVHIIVFLTPIGKNDTVKPRCNMQFISHGEKIDNGTICYTTVHDSFDDRFFNKKQNEKNKKTKWSLIMKKFMTT